LRVFYFNLICAIIDVGKIRGATDKMLGAIIGDVVGSRFEFKDFKSRDFVFFTEANKPTDDSLMTLAVAKGLLNSRGDWTQLSELTQKYMHEIARKHPNVGWGYRFYRWVFELDSSSPNSLGNGAGMRVSPVGWVARDEEEVRLLSRLVTEFTHGHPEGLLGAEAVAMAVFLAREGYTKEYIHKRMVEDYYPSIDSFTLDSIRPIYSIDDRGEWVTCRGSIPQALRAFLESEDFEGAIRNAISIGGDADTIAAMAGSVAEAYYGVPAQMEDEVLKYLSPDLESIYYAFNTIKLPRKQRIDTGMD